MELPQPPETIMTFQLERVEAPHSSMYPLGSVTSELNQDQHVTVKKFTTEWIRIRNEVNFACMPLYYLKIKNKSECPEAKNKRSSVHFNKHVQKPYYVPNTH